MHFTKRKTLAASILFVAGVILGITLAAWYSTAGVIDTAAFCKFLTGLCIVLAYLVYSHLSSDTAEVARP